MNRVTDRTTDTPRTDALVAQIQSTSPNNYDKVDARDEYSYTRREFEMFCSHARQLERELEICRDAHMANCLAADTLRTEIRALRDELAQSKLPVIGECEDCGHKIVTPLKRLA